MGHDNLDEAYADNNSEGTGTIIEIKIKTMDSQTFQLHINNQMTIHDLKERIAALSGMSIERQRLLYRGKALRDDQLLSACNVNSGDTLHLVHNQLVTPSSGSLPSRPGTANNSGAAMHDVHGSASHSLLSSPEITAEEWLSGLLLSLSSTSDVIDLTTQPLSELESTSENEDLYIQNAPLEREEYNLGAGFGLSQFHTQARRGENSSTQQALSDTIPLPPSRLPHDGRSRSIIVEVEITIYIDDYDPSNQNEEGSVEVLQQNTERALQDGLRDHGRHDNLSANAMHEHGEQASNPTDRDSRSRVVRVSRTYLLPGTVFRGQEAAIPIGTTDTINENRAADISSGLSTAELASDPESSDEIEDANAGTSGSD